MDFNQSNDVTPIYDECVTLVKQHKYLEAKKIIKQLLQNNENNNIHILNLTACIYSYLNKHSKALAFLEQAIDIALNNNDSNLKEYCLNYLNMYRKVPLNKNIKKYLRICALYLMNNSKDLDIDISYQLYMILLYDGDIKNSIKCLSKFPDIEYFRINYINCSKLFKNENDIYQARQQVDEALDICQQRLQTMDMLPPDLFPYVPFALSYHGESDRELFIKMSKTYRELYPFLNYQKQDVFQKKSGLRIKVGFITAFFRNHSVSRDRFGIIMNLPRDIFEVYAIFMKPPTDEYGDYITKRVDKVVMIPEISFRNGSFSDVRSQLGDLNLQVLVYCEIGMDLITYCMAYSKLAPIQISTWGHSDTSGIKGIDHFCSSQLYEIEDANNHYSEELIRMPSLCSYYVLPYYEPEPSFCKKELREMGISRYDNLYICPQSLFKLHPKYRKMLKQILEKDPKGYLLFVDSTESYCLMDQIYSYFEDEFGPLIHRMKILDRINPLGRFLDFMSMSVVILDSYPFGGCNTSMEAFYINKVVITLPSKMLNGRFTYGFYQKMGIMDAVAKDEQDYVDKVLYYSHNKEAREALEKRISERKYLLYREVESVRDWTSMLIEKSKPFFELEKLPKQPIPNIIHFVHMGFKPFMYYQYLAVSIAKQVNPDAQIFMYYSQEPPGDLTWWNRVKELVTLEQMSIPLDSTPDYVRKKAYTLSIIKVIEKGGVYLGTNVFCLRSFSKLYKIDTNTIIGRMCTFMDNEGLTYNTFMGRKNAEFLYRWYTSFNYNDNKSIYTYFRRLPLQLSFEESVDLHIEPEWSFAPFEQDILFEEVNQNKIDHYSKYSYCLQLSDELIDKYGHQITPEYMNTQNNNFTHMFRKFVS